MTQNKADMAVISIGVMGENLALNFESKGFTTAVFDIDAAKVKRFVEGRAKGKNIIAPVKPIKNKLSTTPIFLEVFCMKKSPIPQESKASNANNIPMYLL